MIPCSSELLQIPYGSLHITHDVHTVYRAGGAEKRDMRCQSK